MQARGAGCGARTSASARIGARAVRGVGGVENRGGMQVSRPNPGALRLGSVADGPWRRAGRLMGPEKAGRQSEWAGSRCLAPVT